MANGIAIGDPRFLGDEIVIPVSGTMDINTIDELSRVLTPYLRPHERLTLDCRGVRILGHGVNRLLAIQQMNPDCRLKLINVDLSCRQAFKSRRVGEVGFDVRYSEKPEVA